MVNLLVMGEAAMVLHQPMNPADVKSTTAYGTSFKVCTPVPTELTCKVYFFVEAERLRITVLKGYNMDTVCQKS